MMQQRAAVLAEARSWIGTPWHHMADVKGAGVDCAMLIRRVYIDCGLVEAFDPRPYTSDWFLHRGEEVFLSHILAHAHAVADPKPGDLIMFQLGRLFAHAGIVVRRDPLTIVHASAPAKTVLEEDVTRNGDMAIRQKRFFSLWPSVAGGVDPGLSFADK